LSPNLDFKYRNIDKIFLFVLSLLSLAHFLDSYIPLSILVDFTPQYYFTCLVCSSDVFSLKMSVITFTKIGSLSFHLLDHHPNNHIGTLASKYIYIKAPWPQNPHTYSIIHKTQDGAHPSFSVKSSHTYTSA